MILILIRNEFPTYPWNKTNKFEGMVGPFGCGLVPTPMKNALSKFPINAEPVSEKLNE